MKTKKVSHTPRTLPPLTDARREHLAKLAALADELIDTSDIPELTDEAWSAGVRGRFHGLRSSRSPRASTPTCWIG